MVPVHSKHKPPDSIIGPVPAAAGGRSGESKEKRRQERRQLKVERQARRQEGAQAAEEVQSPSSSGEASLARNKGARHREKALSKERRQNKTRARLPEGRGRGSADTEPVPRGGAGEDEEFDDAAFSAEQEPSEIPDHSTGNERPRRLPNPLTVALVTDHQRGALHLFKALQEAFRAADIEVRPDPADPDILIRLGGGHEPVEHPGKTATVVVEFAGGSRASEAARVAKAAGAFFVPMEPLVARYGPETIFHNGELSESGASKLAEWIRDGILEQFSGVLLPPPVGRRPDMEHGVGLSSSPPELLKLLDWPPGQLPKSLRIRCSIEEIEDFLDGAVLLPMDGENHRVQFHLPFEWSIPVEGRVGESRLYGLEFVSSVLTYWFMKASRTPFKPTKQIDAILNRRNISASALLDGAAAVLLDCIRAKGELPRKGWALLAMQRRAAAFQLFLLCSRLAALRKIKFDASACGAVFEALVELLERMRGGGFASLGTAGAVSRHAVLASLALPLRKISFGNLLLDESLQAIHLQLELGMLPDGVWLEGFREQASVVETLALLSADLRCADVSLRSISGGQAKLARFVSALLVNGSCPSIGELAPGRYSKAAKAAQSIMSAAPRTSRVQAHGGKELVDVAIFPDSGFFISRSPAAGKRPASQLVVHARAPTLGGPSLSFSLAETPLLIGGGTADRKAAAHIRRAAREDPGAHNAIRVEGQTYGELVSRSECDLIRMDAIWEEERWCAVRVISTPSEAVELVRTTIHLKQANALLVIDEVRSSRRLSVEQFWHLSPSLQRLGSAVTAYEVPGRGFLNFASDHEDRVVWSQGGEKGIGWTANAKREIIATPFLVRRDQADGEVVMASWFRWDLKPARARVRVEASENGWHASVTGDGLPLSVVFQNGDLQLIAEKHEQRSFA